MKKGLMIFTLGILSFLGINTVKAETYQASNFYLEFDDHLQAYHTYKDNIDYLINYWENNHSSDYPFYFIIARHGTTTSSVKDWDYTLYSTNSTEFVLQRGSLIGLGNTWDGNDFKYTYSYNSITNEYKYSNNRLSFQFSIRNENNVSTYIVDSNISPIFKYQIHRYTTEGNSYTEDFNTILLPSFNSELYSLSIPEIEIKDKDKFPTLKSLYDGSYISNLTNNYLEINLNNYEYIALSLKDYNNIPANNNSLYTNIYVKGQLCITPVYNYGMTERKDVLTGSQIQGCSVYHDDFTLNRMYILKEDVINHAIYYLKSYDKSKDNIVKIDTSVFDISYITEDNKENPIVSINGKDFPTLPYDDLTDSSTISQDNGYTPGVSCPVGDMNCYNDNNPSNIFNNLFDKPLEMLKDVWVVILSFFNLIGEFIALLPPTMQAFLYLAFGIGISLGIIKILVG